MPNRKNKEERIKDEPIDATDDVSGEDRPPIDVSQIAKVSEQEGHPSLLHSVDTRLGGLEVDISDIAQSMRDLNASMQWIMGAQQQQHDQFLLLQHMNGGQPVQGGDALRSQLSVPQSVHPTDQSFKVESSNDQTYQSASALVTSAAAAQEIFPYTDPEDPGFWFDVLSWARADSSWITRMSVRIKQFVTHSIGRSAARTPLLLAWDALMLVARCAPQNLTSVIEDHLHRFWIEVAKAPKGYLVTTELRWSRFPQQLRRHMEREFEESRQNNGNGSYSGGGGGSSRFDDRDASSRYDDGGYGGSKRTRVEYEFRGRPVQRKQ